MCYWQMSCGQKKKILIYTGLLVSFLIVFNKSHLISWSTHAFASIPVSWHAQFAYSVFLFFFFHPIFWTENHCDLPQKWNFPPTIRRVAKLKLWMHNSYWASLLKRWTHNSYCASLLKLWMHNSYWASLLKCWMHNTYWASLLKLWMHNSYWANVLKL